MKEAKAESAVNKEIRGFFILAENEDKISLPDKLKLCLTIGGLFTKRF